MPISEKERARQKRSRERRKEKIRQYERLYSKLHREKETAKRRIRRWKEHSIKDMTNERFEQMHQAQNGGCKICGKVPKRLAVDHCHKTGEVRGLLCHNCNGGLGFFQDSPQLLKLACAYLEDWLSSQK